MVGLRPLILREGNNILDSVDDVAYCWGDMSWSVPQYSRGQVNNAGKVLIDDTVPPGQKELGWVIADNWRSSHAYPLNHFQNLLRYKVAKVDPNGIVVQRQKRRESIELKLHDNPAMKLSQMQDLGGCRAIVSDVPSVYRIIESFEESRMKHELIKIFDYIEDPKSSGYRGVHLIYRYISDSDRSGAYKGLRIEVQLRSSLQHAWATAVEVAGTFRGEALKSSHGSKQWLRFFELMGGEIALTENCPGVPGTPKDRGKLLKELSDRTKKLGVIDLLRGWTSSARYIQSGAIDRAHYYVIELDTSVPTIILWGYNSRQLPEAQAHRASREIETRDDPQIDVVLIAADRLDQVRRAYPNYYLDTDLFLSELERAIS